MDNAEEMGIGARWIDGYRSIFKLDETSLGCEDSLPTRTSTEFFSLLASNPDWTYPETSDSWMASCGDGRTWRFHGHLRWNASSPFSAVNPLWVTDSVNSWGETSTAPVLLRGNVAGPLEVRWSTLAQADSVTRSAWSRSPGMLETLVDQWSGLQAGRSRDANVLVLDTTTNPIAWRWSPLDTGLLHAVLVSDLSISAALSAPLTVFSAGDTLWRPSGPYVYIQAGVASTSGEDFYKAVRLRAAGGLSLVDISPGTWPMEASSLDLIPGFGYADTSDYYFPFPAGNGNASKLELALAGTCPSQRTWLHEGGSNRSQLPHGNVGPLDGFVCEVQTDTMSFPLGQ